MKALLTLSLLTTLVACGKHTDIQIIQTTVTAPTATTSEQQDVLNLIRDENDYRIGQGQTMLSSGLTATLQTFATGDRIQASIADHNTLAGLVTVGSFTLKETFNQLQSNVNDGMNVLPLALRNTYKTNYLLRASGYIVITESDYYQFDLTSDDASVLYLDGVKLIDNDNAHGTTLKTSSKFLRRGLHSFRLDYAQNGGEQALMLYMNGSLIDPSRFVK